MQFQTDDVSQYAGIVAKFIVAGPARVGMSEWGAGIEAAYGSLMIGYARKPYLMQ